MRTSTISLLVPLVLAVACCFSGCDDRGTSDSTSMSTSVDKVRVDVDATQEQADGAVAALDRLQKAPAGTDLTALYKDFSADVDKADDSSRALKARAADMESRKETYLADWNQQLSSVNDPNLKEQGEARSDEVRKSFDKALDAIHTAQSKVDPLIADLQDIKKSLGYDLTSPGVAAISKPVDTAHSQSSDADSALQDARKELQKVSATIDNQAPKA